MFILAGVGYLVGLILIAMPPGSLPILDGTRPPVRLGKHISGLALFGLGTVGIHNRLPGNVRLGFVIFSAILILVLGLIRIWEETSEEDLETSTELEESAESGEH